MLRPLDRDAEITLFVPTPVVVYEHVLRNTGWSLLDRVDAEAFTMRFLSETPVR
ncbi:MAG: hypothetical protein JNK72_25975 [Myxococcales bacterium]|nr:hypothetical protein [Myxococcales bacterium]